MSTFQLWTSQGVVQLMQTAPQPHGKVVLLTTQTSSHLGDDGWDFIMLFQTDNMLLSLSDPCDATDRGTSEKQGRITKWAVCLAPWGGESRHNKWQHFAPEVTMWDVMMFIIGTLASLSLSVVHPLSLGVCVVVCKPEGCGHLRKRLLIINPFSRGL